MNVLTSSILPLNKGGFATSTLTPPFYCSKVATCCCRPVIRVRSCSSQVGGGGCGAGAVGCSAGCCCCCCCCWDMYGSSGNRDGNDDDDFS